MSAFQQLIDSRLSFGLYQKRLLVLAFTSSAMIGAVQMSVFIAAQRITKDHLLDTFRSSVILTLPPAANLSGSFLIGYLADVLGRHRVILFVDFITIFTIIALYFIDYYFFFIPAFLVLAYFNSTAVNVMFAYVSELVPSRLRGKMQTFLAGMTGFGRLGVTLLCMWAFDPYMYGNWKLPFMVVGIIIGVIFSGLRFWMKPSIPQLYKLRDFKALLANFSEIQHINLEPHKARDSDYVLSKTELETVSSKEGDNKVTQNRCRLLFGKETFRKSVSLLVTRSVIAIMSNSEMAIAPVILGTDTKGLSLLMLFVFGEITGTFFCALVIDRFGRKFTLYLSLVLILVSLVSQMFVLAPWYPWMMFARRIFVRSGQTAIEVMFVEYFEANVRSTAIGIALTTTGTCITIVNLFVIRILNTGTASLLIFYTAVVTVGFIASCVIPRHSAAPK